MKERRRRDQSIDEVRDRQMGRRPRANDADNYAATGIFQPSENPRLGSNLSPETHQVQGGLTQLRRELDAQQDTTAPRQGQVEFPNVEGTHDLVVGPDMGERPHKPTNIRPKQK
jgi:hypothetical protein